MKYGSLIRAVALSVFCTIPTIQSVWAIDMNADIIDLKRRPSGAALTKGDVVNEVKKTYKGRILSISRNDKGGDDCHVVKLLSNSGEFTTIHVTCDFK